MDTKTLQRLRPRDTSAAAIRDALAVIAEQRAATVQKLAEAKAARPSLLLEGSTKEITAADDAIRAAEVELEQLAAMAAALEPQLVQAQNAEATAALEGQAEEAEAAVQRFREWLEGQYPGLAAKLAAGLELERVAIQARARFIEARQALARRFSDLPFIGVSMVPMVPNGGGLSSLGQQVRLPAAKAGERAPWMPTPAPAGEGTVYARSTSAIVINPAA